MVIALLCLQQNTPEAFCWANPTLQGPRHHLPAPQRLGDIPKNTAYTSICSPVPLCSWPHPGPSCVYPSSYQTAAHLIRPDQSTPSPSHPWYSVNSPGEFQAVSLACDHISVAQQTSHPHRVRDKCIPTLRLPLIHALLLSGCSSLSGQEPARHSAQLLSWTSSPGSPGALCCPSIRSALHREARPFREGSSCMTRAQPCCPTVTASRPTSASSTRNSCPSRPCSHPLPT